MKNELNASEVAQIADSQVPAALATYGFMDEDQVPSFADQGEKLISDTGVKVRVGFSEDDAELLKSLQLSKQPTAVPSVSNRIGKVVGTLDTAAARFEFIIDTCVQLCNFELVVRAVQPVTSPVATDNTTSDAPAMLVASPDEHNGAQTY